ncbi:hypothetical protein PF011_g23147 [Phytophthora fragariae]|uniref:Uncharacterized protein n=1 Tax=Phytophthora fragariae TaxID=53985 RepID=A0A6A3I937_9STRA|nr:hypothetical protein PF009_g25434 [Phytophthora fragariae]KAE8978661.1 hypothetical protein PF011_g23147 [Phytophthora fragariae]
MPQPGCGSRDLRCRLGRLGVLPAGMQPRSSLWGPSLPRLKELKLVRVLDLQRELHLEPLSVSWEAWHLPVTTLLSMIVRSLATGSMEVWAVWRRWTKLGRTETSRQRRGSHS